jgi:hypothetical protein
VHALLVDSPAAPASEQPSAADRQAGGSAGPPEDGSPDRQPAGRTCANCEAPLRDGQEWCLQCGAGQPGSLDGERPNWRPLGTLALVAVLLTGAAAAAGAAALSSHKAAAPKTLTVAQAPLPAPTTSTPTASTPTTPVTPGTASTPKVPAPKPPQGGTGASNPLFPSTGKPPTIPAPTSTPKSTGTGTGTSTGSGESPNSTTTGSSEKSSTTESKPSGGETEQPSAILLDTDAASTYNPYSYPETGFGDPGLAIDGEVTTAWTGQVQPSSAPNMAEGLVVDLKSPTKLGAVKLITETPGMTVQLYGATGSKPPATITEPGWTPLSATRVLKKKSTRIKLHVAKGFRFVVVWVIKAPAAAVGTPQAPGHVDLNEVELFPRAS